MIKTRMMMELVFGLVLLCARAMWSFKEDLMEDPYGNQYKLARGPVFPAVRVHCTDTSMVVRVRADLYGTGVRVHAHELRLGPRGVTGACAPEQLQDDEYVITANLHECGAQKRLEDQMLVYFNTLFHSPVPNHYGITRTASTAVPVECRYRRIHFVSSKLLPPISAPPLNLQLQTDEWTSDTSLITQREENINMVATVLSFGDVPLKLFVDRCVVTEHDDLSMPVHDFINNHGCSADPASGVSFLPRTEDHVLRMQLNLPASTRGQRSTATLISITCWMKTADVVQEESRLNKGCSYIGNSWRSCDGTHQVCGCCNGRYDVIGSRRKRRWSSNI